MSVERDGVVFHNAAELHSLDDGRGGHRLQRVPEAVREGLNEGASERVRWPAGCELRFVPDGPVTVRLSAREETTVDLFWGPLRRAEQFELQGGRVVIGPEPREITVERPADLDALDAGALGGHFSPVVARLRPAGYPSPVRYHGVEGDHRPPRVGEVPGRTHLAYGTSITQGAAAMGEHLTYAGLTARHLGADLRNLGTGGSAYCDRSMADYLPETPWDVATLSLSVNMVGTFDVATFRERAGYMVERAAETGRPVVAVTLFPHGRDLLDDPDIEPEPYRGALRDVAAEAPANVHLVEGPDLLDRAGLSADLVHPSDHGMASIARELAARVEPLL
jgi:lysophospholipase L1-like esterase